MIAIPVEYAALGAVAIIYGLGVLFRRLRNRERTQFERTIRQLERAVEVARRHATGLTSELNKARAELKLLRNTEGQTQRDADLVVAWMLRLLAREKETTKRERS